MAEESSDSQEQSASLVEPEETTTGDSPTAQQAPEDPGMQAPNEPSADAAQPAPSEESTATGNLTGSDETQAATQVAETQAEAVPPTDAPPAAAASSQSATTPFEPPDFAAAGPATKPFAIDMLDDVELDVKIELGRTEMYIEDVLGLGAGSVVKLDKAAGDPVDIFINERLVARGEVLVLNDSFCVRINDILSPIPELERDE